MAGPPSHDRCVHQEKEHRQGRHYVAISHAQYEARIYTDDAAKLPIAIERERRKHAAP